MKISIFIINFRGKECIYIIDQGVNFSKLAKNIKIQKVGKMTFGALWLHSGPMSGENFVLAQFMFFFPDATYAKEQTIYTRYMR